MEALNHTIHAIEQTFPASFETSNHRKQIAIDLSLIVATVALGTLAFLSLYQVGILASTGNVVFFATLPAAVASLLIFTYRQIQYYRQQREEPLERTIENLGLTVVTESDGRQVKEKLPYIPPDISREILLFLEPYDIALLHRKHPKLIESHKELTTQLLLGKLIERIINITDDIVEEDIQTYGSTFHRLPHNIPPLVTRALRDISPVDIKATKYIADRTHQKFPNLDINSEIESLTRLPCMVDAGNVHVLDPLKIYRHYKQISGENNFSYLHFELFHYVAKCIECNDKEKHKEILNFAIDCRMKSSRNTFLTRSEHYKCLLAMLPFDVLRVKNILNWP